MADYLFFGSSKHNGGPDNVNKNIKNNLTSKFTYIKSTNKVAIIIEIVWKIITCKVVVVSGFHPLGYYTIVISKFLGKKIIYIMHGCIELEAKLNGFAPNIVNSRRERFYLESADIILPVSRKFSQQMQSYFPQHKDKFRYLYNGVATIDIDGTSVERVSGSVIAVGGDRKLKNNITIARAISQIPQVGILKVYGHIYDTNNLPKAKNIRYMGLVSQDTLYKELMSSEIYVLNSIYEPFALSVFDALLCGCSILITSVSGALDLLPVTENDIINNPYDEKEIAEKIEYLLSHPNNQRLREAINLEKLSYREEVNKLQMFCDELT